MKTFIALYYAPAEAMAASAQATEAEKAEGMKAWFAWKDKHDAHILDFGAPSLPGQRIDAGRNWQPAGTEIGGYSMVQADSLDHAKTLFADHPHLDWVPGCTIEVAELARM